MLNCSKLACGGTDKIRSSRQEVFCKKGVSLPTETRAKMFSCEFCEIFKNTFFYRTPSVAASAKTYSYKMIASRFVFQRFSRTLNFHTLETVSQRCSVKKVFLEILQNSLENTCATVSFLIKLQA